MADEMSGKNEQIGMYVGNQGPRSGFSIGGANANAQAWAN